MKELLSLADSAVNGLRYIIDVMCVEACHGYTSILCLLIVSISILPQLDGEDEPCKYATSPSKSALASRSTP